MSDREEMQPVCTHDTCCCEHCGDDCGCDCQQRTTVDLVGALRKAVEAARARRLKEASGGE